MVARVCPWPMVSPSRTIQTRVLFGVESVDWCVLFVDMHVVSNSRGCWHVRVKTCKNIIREVEHSEFTKYVGGQVTPMAIQTPVMPEVLVPGFLAFLLLLIEVGQGTDNHWLLVV